MLRQLIGRFLAESGWAVAEAGNADDALQILKRTDEGHAIDLLITDVEMRGRKDGFVLAAGAVTMCPDIKVLYISGHFEDRPAVRQGLREAGRSFIRKPFSRDDFLQAINNALESPRDAADAFAAILGHPSVEARAIADQPTHRSRACDTGCGCRSGTGWPERLTGNAGSPGTSVGRGCSSMPHPRSTWHRSSTRDPP